MRCIFAPPCPRAAHRPACIPLLPSASAHPCPPAVSAASASMWATWRGGRPTWATARPPTSERRVGRACPPACLPACLPGRSTRLPPRGSRRGRASVQATRGAVRCCARHLAALLLPCCHSPWQAVCGLRRPAAHCITCGRLLLATPTLQGVCGRRGPQVLPARGQVWVRPVVGSHRRHGGRRRPHSLGHTRSGSVPSPACSEPDI